MAPSHDRMNNVVHKDSTFTFVNFFHLIIFQLSVIFTHYIGHPRSVPPLCTQRRVVRLVQRRQRLHRTPAHGRHGVPGDDDRRDDDRPESRPTAAAAAAAALLIPAIGATVRRDRALRQRVHRALSDPFGTGTGRPKQAAGSARLVRRTSQAARLPDGLPTLGSVVRAAGHVRGDDGRLAATDARQSVAGVDVCGHLGLH